MTPKVALKSNVSPIVAAFIYNSVLSRLVQFKYKPLNKETKDEITKVITEIFKETR